MFVLRGMEKAPVILSFAMLCMALVSRCVSLSNIIMNARLLALAVNPFGSDNAQYYSC